MVDLERLERALIDAARNGRPVTYAQLLGLFGRRVGPNNVRALCRDLGRVGAKLETRGAPDLACLVVRQSDGLPGEGWFGWARERMGYDGPSRGVAARAFLDDCQERAVTWARRLAAASFMVLTAGQAQTAPVTLGGITFSDELGGVELKDGWGSGKLDDPFVLVETITDDGPAVLVVRGLRPRFGNPLGTPQTVGFALRKIVTNGTSRDWHGFELELREELERTSDYGDGLSFGQATRETRPFLADRFASVVQRDEPLDAVEFGDGFVERGHTVTVTMLITDYTPRFEFFLLQRRDSPVAGGSSSDVAVSAATAPR